MKHYDVYILTNRKYGSLYIGYTNDLQRRIMNIKQN
jgi:predicted GIY-YIG superfamily endonuclease